MKISEVLSNPVRFRIVQYLQMKGDATTKQISEELDDIPVPTLYRHINRLLSEGLLVVKDEKKIRGTVERTIALNEEAWSSQVNGNIGDVAYQFFMSLYDSFREYGSKEDADPIRDKLSMRTVMVRMSDEAFDSFIQEYKDLLSRYQDSQEGRLRSISFVSAPVIKEVE